jgi:DNA topoisomerase-3
MKRLIVAEKPSVAREFARALGARWSAGESRDGHYESDAWLVTFCLGHMMRMKDPEEYREEWRRWSADPIRPERFEKLVIEATAPQAERVIALILRDDVAEIVNAGDAGREGEGIQRELYEEAFRRMGRAKPVKRFWTSSAHPATPSSRVEAVARRAAFDGLYRAFLARERSDWLVGSTPRAYTSTFARGEAAALDRPRADAGARPRRAPRGGDRGLQPRLLHRPRPTRKPDDDDRSTPARRPPTRAATDSPSGTAPRRA